MNLSDGQGREIQNGNTDQSEWNIPNFILPSYHLFDSDSCPEEQNVVRGNTKYKKKQMSIAQINVIGKN